MNLLNNRASGINALVLLACALFAGFDIFAFAFAIGDGDGKVSPAAGTLLIGTLAGAMGLIIAAFASWIRRPGIGVLSLVSILSVLPATGLFGWSSVSASLTNTKLGMHYSFWEWALAIFPPFLCLFAAALSVLRLRQIRQIPSPSRP